MSTQNELFVKMAVSAWQAENKKLDAMIDKYSEEQWLKETAPGRNTGIYLLGHLTAVNDNLLTMLSFSGSMYPQLQDIFLFNSDKSGVAKPSVAELKDCWHKINLNLDAYMAKMQADEWFTKHTKVSEEDFIKEPHRNKLNVLMSRTVHQSYHLGQLAYLG